MTTDNSGISHMDQRCRALLLFAAAMGLCSTVCLPVLAQGSPADGATAQALFDQGRKLMAEGKYAEACPKLEESQRLDPGSGTLINLGECYEQEGKLAAAWGKFLEAEAAARLTNNAERERVARERAQALFPRVPNMTIRVTGGDATPGLEIKRDGTRVGSAQWGTPMPIDPGEHKVTASAPGRRTWESHAMAAQGETVTVLVPELPAALAVPPDTAGALATPPKPDSVSNDNEVGDSSASRMHRMLALGAGAVGVSGLVVGAIFGLKSKSKHDDAADSCPHSPACPDQRGVNLMQEAKTAGNVSTLGLLSALSVSSAAPLFGSP